jgi:hypothetical protein
LRAVLHDTEATLAFPSTFNAARPGTPNAVPHEPFFSLTRNAW